jgi:uncharacterized protein (TIGR02147 family)
MQTIDLFQYKDYKKYTNDRLDNSPKARGVRTDLANSINCQTAYVSSVLRGGAHFTLEQGEAINSFFQHSDLECDYFLILLQLQRAGTLGLKNRLQKNLNKILEARFTINKRIDVSPLLSEADQIIYYSEWYYSAIHALTSIPEFQTLESIATRLALSKNVVSHALSFLKDVGLVTVSKNIYNIGPTRIHLGSESPMISRHHNNWRMVTAQLLHKRAPSDLHYSSVVTMSHDDADKLREMIVQFIANSKEIIKKSKEEELFSLDLDFFKV